MEVLFSRIEAYERNIIKKVLEGMLDDAGLSGCITPGDRILVKPNLVSSFTPERAATTHPAFVEAVCRLLIERGAKPVISDSPGGLIRSPKGVFDITGMSDVISRLDLETVHLEAGKPGRFRLEDETDLHLTGYLDEIDGIVNLPKLKSHCLTLSTLAVKNLYGLVPGFRKGEYHKYYPTPKRFAWIMAEIYSRVRDKIRLNIVDGIVGMEGNGPSAGTARAFGIAGLSRDAAALDAALENLLGFKRPSPILKELVKRGLVPEHDVSWMEGEALSISDFRIPSNWHLNMVPTWLSRILGGLVQVYPKVIAGNCVRCGLCMRSCPVGAISTEPAGSCPKFDYKRCIRCQCCSELCPESAIFFRKTFLTRLYS